MKRFIYFLLITLLFSAGSVYSQKKQAVTFKPEKPLIEEKITFNYDQKAETAVLKDEGDITLQVLAIPETGLLVLDEIKLEKKGSMLSGSYKIKDKNTKLLLVRFISGDKIDDNENNLWKIMVYGKNKKPVMGAHLAVWQVLKSGGFGEISCRKDNDESKSELNKELELNPNNIAAKSTSWSLFLREKPGDETKETIKKELAKLYEANKNDESKVALLLSWFDKTDQSKKADEIIEKGTSTNPKGKIAKYKITREISKEKSNEKKIELYRKILSDFTDLTESEKENYNNNIIYAYIQIKQYDEASQLLETLPKKDGNLYNSLAWPLIEKGEQLEKAVEWAKKGVDLLKNPDNSLKPSYMSNKSWNEDLKYSKAMIFDTYGYGLFKLGKFSEAEAAYEESYKLNGKSADVDERYVECLIKNEKYDKVIQISAECLDNKIMSDKIISNYKIAYLKNNGNEKDFNQKIDDIKNKEKKEVKLKLQKEMLNKPAIDFTLKSLDGKEVKLSDLKGKVVVLDFWATWCGPCKASFPTLQKMYDKYKNNPNIVFLALDTWEKEKGEEREKNVRKFIEDNKYTFTVLFDDNFVTKYEVEGIPTKFTIDKEGKLQFKSVGFYDENKMTNELESQFEILLGDNFRTNTK